MRWAGDVSLRHWLDKPDRCVDEYECFHVFSQIVDFVNMAHSQGIIVNNVRPSCFYMSSFNHVSFIESASCSDSGSDSLEDGGGGLNFNNNNNNHRGNDVRNSSSPLLLGLFPQQKSGIGGSEEDFRPVSANALSEISCIQSSSACVPLVQDNEQDKFCDRVPGEGGDRKEPFPMKEILLMETGWYTSPEEISGSTTSLRSDIYRLGVLLFELFCPVHSREDKSRTMSSLRHRVLPPQLLLSWPKAASFCLWLLHPDPNSRPSVSDVLQSEFLAERRDKLEEREAAIQLRESIEEEDLLLEFLLLVQQRKQEAADKLRDTISLLCSDIEEIMKHQKSEGSIESRATDQIGKDDLLDSEILPLSTSHADDCFGLGSRKRCRPGCQIQDGEECDDNIDECRNSSMGGASQSQESQLFKNSRLIRNFKKLEAAYLLTRCRPVRPFGRSVIRNSPASSDARGSAVASERSSISALQQKDWHVAGRQSGWISPFLEGLCKYLSMTNLKVKADLKQGDLLSSSNLVCSLSFDRDGEFFAAAGVNKKIKVFDCDAIINEHRDINYPVVEMASRSKLSSICWNSYIKSQIASSNFEGVVQVWDASRGQVQTELREHERRVWSIDFSPVDPTLLASGSDDGSVKLWSINQGVSIGTIKTKANVCCVQFPLGSSRSLAFGSADHRIYYYDLRNSRAPLCTLVGHSKTVSYVKFLDTTTIVSASTDNTLKLWDLSACTTRVNDTPLHSFTGHTNVKNFVGLSVSDGYIATGSETNEVVIYHRAFPMPALSHKFNTTDPISGDEMEDTSQFISSVCWRGQSSTLVAANSTGNIKILEMG
ncbi:Protein SPA1-RELATED 3 [Linum perenne]